VLCSGAGLRSNSNPSGERGTELRGLAPYGLSPRSKECLAVTLNCSSAGGVPIVAQNKAPRSMAETIVMATSFKFIGSKSPAATLTKISRQLLSEEL
jgi:hypothetical protein